MLAHNVGGGALPAPPWLLGYIGVALVLGTAAALRATWPRVRLARSLAASQPDPVIEPAVGVGNLVGLALFGAVIYAALAGPDSVAANIAPTAVFPVWCVGLVLLCLLVGDVMAVLNPFVPVVALLERIRPPRPVAAPPTWTSAVFLASVAWFFVAYHRPGSPRAVAVLLLVYAASAVAGGLVWGRSWLRAGEAFGGLSAAASRVGLRAPSGPAPAGTGPLMIVLIGFTAFDAFTGRPFWVDVRGTSQGWSRTVVDTVGLIWLTAIAAGAFLLVVRLAERSRDGSEDGSLSVAFGRALVPIGLAWYLGHEITLLLSEGQNFYALLSDPLGRGWNVFGTRNHTVDYRLITGVGVRWLQLLFVFAGHVGVVILVHDTALARLRRRPAMRTTWTMAAVASVSVVAAALLVLT